MIQLTPSLDINQYLTPSFNLYYTLDLYLTHSIITNTQPGAVPVDVRGAHGMNAFKINGVYEPIDEYSGGWPVYHRRGGVDYWLEYTEERGTCAIVCVCECKYE